MNKYLKKQIFIIFIVFIFIIIFIFLYLYFNKPVQSCFDKIKNQDEENIDCGGICDICEISHPENINVLSAQAILNQGNFYDAMIQVKNPNQNSGSANILYNIKLYNKNNSLIGERSGSTFILPNQTKYIIELKIESSDVVNKIDILFEEIIWEQVSEEIPQLVISQKEYNNNKVRGIINNKTSINFNKININILLFNSSQELIGLNKTELKTLLAGQERDFTVAWFKQLSEQVASIKAEAETNIFDKNNIIKIY